MKLSINFVKDYVDIDKDVKTLADDMTKAGNEYDSEGKLIPATNLVVGEIIECENHPDSDHLHVCKVNVGKEVLQIVCGAPNARKGLKAIVSLEGAELPNGVKIKKGCIRGVESCGMMCSLAELGIENKFLSEEDKNGICELPENAIPGEDPIKVLQLDDEVIDFDLTANRGDLLSILGMAYELGAIYDKKVKDIDLRFDENGESIDGKFDVKVNTENCSLFLAKKVCNVTIKESPKFIKNRLIASGIRPINNVVDISNYVMLEVGQPLHYYDADKLNGMLEVRMAKNDEKLVTLDEEERILNEEDIVISNGKEAIGLAGVMGGLDTEITENTKNIVIEAAIFDPIKVRKTSKKIVRSEASNRFEKGLDPNRTYMAIKRSCVLLQKYAGATICKGMAKYENVNLDDTKINITFENINRILGVELEKEKVLSAFERLGFSYEMDNNEENILVSVPKRRVDIKIKEDLIEEVGRIYGVDNIKGRLPKLPLKAGSYNKTIRQIRNKMVDLGLNETLSYILVNKEEAKGFVKLEEGMENARLLDPMSEDRSTLRYSVISSLVKIYEYNKVHYNKDISIFEIGKGFFKNGESYGENQKLAVLMTGDRFNSITLKKQIDFYTIKGVLEDLLNYMGYEGRYTLVPEENAAKQMHPYQTANINVNGENVGIIGKLNPEYIKEDVYVFEINLDKLLDKKVSKMKYKEFSKFPSVKKDLAIIVEKDITSEEISKAIKKAAGKLLLSSKVFDIYTGKGIEENKKSIAYSLEFGTMERTLNDEEINEIMQKIIESLEKEYKAELRK